MAKKAKKITKDELASANEWVTKINQFAKRLQDYEIGKLDSYGALNQCRAKLEEIKKQLEDKYGNDCEINLETGELTRPEEKKN